ncbi:MAG: TetR/AcrR family transcriptional regulator [Planctomycetota bacterium]|nr:TetR/AcrR family transcriptional regulator [Planctomycetota bacterium]
MTDPDHSPSQAPTEPCTEAARGPGRPRSEASRQAILTAAYELLQEKPLPEITSAALAKRAGVSKATLYRWWSSKEAIVLDGYFDAIEHRFPPPATDDPMADLRSHLRDAYSMMGGPDGRIFASLVASGNFHEKLREALNEQLNSPRCRDTQKLLVRAVEAGRLAPALDLELCTELIWGPAFFRLMTGAPIEDDLADRVLGMLVCGLGTKA